MTALLFPLTSTWQPECVIKLHARLQVAASFDIVFGIGGSSSLQAATDIWGPESALFIWSHAHIFVSVRHIRYIQ